jgi:hypothetical protein
MWWKPCSLNKKIFNKRKPMAWSFLPDVLGPQMSVQDSPFPQVFWYGLPVLVQQQVTSIMSGKVEAKAIKADTLPGIKPRLPSWVNADTKIKVGKQLLKLNVFFSLFNLTCLVQLLIVCWWTLNMYVSFYNYTNYYVFPTLYFPFLPFHVILRPHQHHVHVILGYIDHLPIHQADNVVIFYFPLLVISSMRIPPGYYFCTWNWTLKSGYST